MKTKLLPTLVLLFALALCTQAQTVPEMMSYQGRLSANGTNFNGAGYFKFALVSADGLTTYWSNDGTGVDGLEPFDAVAVPVSNGLFAVMLGDKALANMTQLLTIDLFQDNDDAHLRIWFGETGGGAFNQLTPDQPLGSVGYALTAGSVGDGAIGELQLDTSSVTPDKIEAGAVTAAKLATNSVTADKIADGVITSNKIDWSTMPSQDLKGYAENGTFWTAPVASGTESIAQGFGAQVLGNYSVVGGGFHNDIGNDSTYATVAGGYENDIGDNSAYATVAGGYNNNIALNADYSAISGGRLNDIGNDSQHAAVAGGYDNNIGDNSTNATVSGGYDNDIGNGSGSATVAGGYRNLIYENADYSTIGGGNYNAIGNNSPYATVAGGKYNAISTNADYSTIGGGDDNIIRGYADSSVIGGGSGNEIGLISQYATVAGGRTNNMAYNNHYSTIGGGRDNDIGTNSQYATVAGGYDNDIGTNVYYAILAGGRLCAVGNNASYAFAAGRRAKANHPGAFVWADSTNADIASTNNNSVSMRAYGGYRLFSGSGLGARLAPNNTAWSIMSDRNLKENFAPIDILEILEKVAGLPLTAWNYKADPDQRRYIGPVAQDFHAAFGLGDDTSINTLDTDGVALAAIQGLYAVVEDQQLELDLLRQENADLQARLERLEAVLAP